MEWGTASVRVTCGRAVFSTPAVQMTGAEGHAADFELRVPARITRRFRGRLDVTRGDGELVPVVSMDRETAVASIVAAEQVKSVPLEALKAQAVAARSFLAAAGRRHHDFDFCDTTHCQFLRDPPAETHPASLAARSTAGIVLLFRGAPMAAYYSANCGGRTRTLVEAGLNPAESYPYFSVECPHTPTGRERSGHGVGLAEGRRNGVRARRRSTDLRHYYPARPYRRGLEQEIKRSKETPSLLVSC